MTKIRLGPSILNKEDLIEFCDIICELEFIMNQPENEGYFDLFIFF